MSKEVEEKTEMSEEIKTTDMTFIKDSGLLFEINRRVLHPFGLAISVREDVLTDEWVVANVWDYRDDEEGMIFEEETFQHGLDKLNKFMENIGNEKLRKRKELLGYVIQGEDLNTGGEAGDNNNLDA